MVMKKAHFTTFWHIGFQFLLLSLIILSCSQDPIFFNASIEPKPKDPIIAGSPTNMVVLKNRIFVGSLMGKNIWAFNGRWFTIERPGGSLGGLATDGTDLYALIFPGGEPLKSSVIKKYEISSGTWIAAYSAPGYSIQTICGAGGEIFAGAQARSNYMENAILHLNGASLDVIQQSPYLLSSAAVSNTSSEKFSSEIKKNTNGYLSISD